MKNPLNKRFPRELKAEAGKYAVIFLFMIIVIGFVSGFMVASGSAVKTYKESFERYQVEDGHFSYAEEAGKELVTSLAEQGITVVPDFYKERETKEVDSTLRIYKIREKMNLVCLMEGALPKNGEEIAIDRLYAKNNSIKIGDVLTLSDKQYKVSGFVALPDYAALFSDPSDMMFDSIKFGVAVMTEEGFTALGESRQVYCYSWRYEKTPKDDIEAKAWSEELVPTLLQHGELTGMLPMYCNQAIQFPGDDMGKDRMMFTAFLYIVVIIIAFIMGITTNNTIMKESMVIGTLRASGYTRGELLRHYLAMPMAVILFSALVGNILGYTLFEGVVKEMYYINYSLTTYETFGSPDAFLRTTIVPVLLMFFINLVILFEKLCLSPLQFLRRNLKRKQPKRALRLNEKKSIMHRFRIRILLQNMPNYVTIIFGVFLANLILFMGVGLNNLVKNSKDCISENMFCRYQYVLKLPVETNVSGAEKYVAESLETEEGKYTSEKVSVYGVEANSRYVELDTAKEGVYVSSGYAEKYGVKAGDTVTLKEVYGVEEYEFPVTGIFPYPTTIAVFGERSYINEALGYEAEYFNGYMSEAELTDVDESLVAVRITEDDLNKLSRQMTHSMSGILEMFLWFGIAMFMLIIYLLSKIIIEKNAQSVSMTKILGYNNREISSLYIKATGLVTVLSLVLTMPLVNWIMKKLCVLLFATFPGWLPYEISFSVFVKMFFLGVGSYAVIAFFQFRKVKKIPLNTALKNVE